MRKLLGIDLGAHELKLAEWNGSSVSALYCADTPENLISDGHIISYEAAADFIKETFKASKIRTREACILLPAEDVFIRRVVVPYMDDAKLLVNLPYEFHDFLTGDKTKYYYDYTVNETINDEDGKPVQMDITAGAVSKELISLYRAMLRRAGLSLAYAIPTELAFSNLIALDEDNASMELCILDVGHSSSRLDIFTGSRYENTRIIDKGLRAIDLAIAEKENVDEHIAHEYKESNLNGYAEDKTASSVYSAIANETRRAINFYSLNNRDSSLEDLYLCGSGCHMNTLTGILSETVGITIHPASELFPSVSADREDIGAFTAAIGASLQSKGMNLAKKEKSPLRVSLLIPLVVLVLALAVLFAKLAVIDRYQKLYDAQQELSDVRAFNELLKKETSDYDEVYNEYVMYSTKWMTESESVLVTRENMLKLVEKELYGKGRILNFSSSQNALTVELAGVTLDDTSKLLAALNSRDDVISVDVSNAKADALTYEYVTVDEDGVEVIDTKTESIVTLTIMMKTPGGDVQ